MSSLSWPARLFALTRGHSADQAELPTWPLAWILSQQQSEAELTPFPSASPQRLALSMKRRTRHPPGSHSLEASLHQSARALHPVQRLAWLMELIDSYGNRAIEPLLKSLGVALNRPSPFLELGEALAWALGQYGREILLVIKERFKDAPFLVREYYCQALWYLGKEARGCQTWLCQQNTEWAEAVFYRLENLGSQILIQRRRVPIWLDQDSIDQLALLAFSQEPGDRLYALRALDGWGPQHLQAVQLVRATLQDSDDEVKFQAWRTLLSLGEIPDADNVYTALCSQHNQLVQLASDHCDLLLGQHSPLQALEKSLKNNHPTMARLALARLLSRPLPPNHLRRFLCLLKSLSPEQQHAAIHWIMQQDWGVEDWARMIELVPPCLPLLDRLAHNPATTIALYMHTSLRQRLLQHLNNLIPEHPLQQQLQGACLSWDHLLTLKPEQRKHVLNSLIRAGQLPEQLLRPLLSGQWISSESLELIRELSSGLEQLKERLSLILSISGPAENWTVAQDICLTSHPHNFELATLLAQEGKARAAIHALRFLQEHYCIRERPRLLAIIIQCLKHPDKEVRLEALHHLQLNAPLPQEVADALYHHLPDSDLAVEGLRQTVLKKIQYLASEQ